MNSTAMMRQTMEAMNRLYSPTADAGNVSRAEFALDHGSTRADGLAANDNSLRMRIAA